MFFVSKFLISLFSVFMLVSGIAIYNSREFGPNRLSLEGIPLSDNVATTFLIAYFLIAFLLFLGTISLSKKEYKEQESYPFSDTPKSSHPILNLFFGSLSLILAAIIIWKEDIPIVFYILLILLVLVDIFFKRPMSLIMLGTLVLLYVFSPVERDIYAIVGTTMLMIAMVDRITYSMKEFDFFLNRGNVFYLGIVWCFGFILVLAFNEKIDQARVTPIVALPDSFYEHNISFETFTSSEESRNKLVSSKFDSHKMELLKIPMLKSYNSMEPDIYLTDIDDKNTLTYERENSSGFWWGIVVLVIGLLFSYGLLGIPKDEMSGYYP